MVVLWKERCGDCPPSPWIERIFRPSIIPLWMFVGDLGPVYGFQWRHSGAHYTNMHADYADCGVDQLSQVIDLVRNDPDSRRIIMCAWNPSGQVFDKHQLYLILMLPVVHTV